MTDTATPAATAGATTVSYAAAAASAVGANNRSVKGRWTTAARVSRCGSTSSGRSARSSG